MTADGEMEQFADADVVAAIRLAVEASADARTLRKVLDAILARAEASDHRATGPVRLLVDAIKDARAEFVVTDAQPRGQMVPAGKRASRQPPEEPS